MAVLCGCEALLLLKLAALGKNVPRTERWLITSQECQWKPASESEIMRVVLHFTADFRAVVL